MVWPWIRAPPPLIPLSLLWPDQTHGPVSCSLHAPSCHRAFGQALCYDRNICDAHEGNALKPQLMHHFFGKATLSSVFRLNLQSRGSPCGLWTCIISASWGLRVPSDLLNQQLWRRWGVTLATCVLASPRVIPMPATVWEPLADIVHCLMASMTITLSYLCIWLTCFPH